MGGDHAPESVVKGCVEAVRASEGFDVLLIGDEPRIRAILRDEGVDDPRIGVLHASEKIDGHDVPTNAIKSKTDSSMVKGFRLLKEGKGDAFISAGNSGALMVGSLLILGRIRGVDRPALAAVVPSDRGGCLMLDVGLNTMAKPLNFLQFAQMGSAYYADLFGKSRPQVGLVNIGTEEGKGSETIKAAFDLLKDSGLNFIGNVESKDILFDRCDIAVCDGFTGNVLLKSIEGTAKYVFIKIKAILGGSFASKLAGLVLKKRLRRFRDTLDADENGGAPLLGVNGLVIKSHGNSTSTTIRNVIIKTAMLAEKGFQGKLNELFARTGTEDHGDE
jgi:glycerol-3-phosphate acyltransferase PlsX